MRDYAKHTHRLYSGTTGRRLRESYQGTPAMAPIWALAGYLFGCSHANMLGIYRLPVAYIVADLGLTEADVRAALAALVEVDYCRYDAETECVWVVNMAAVQILEAGKPSLKPTDNRVDGIHKMLANLPPCPWIDAFRVKYATAFHFDPPPQQGDGRPSEGASMGGGSPSEAKTGAGAGQEQELHGADGKAAAQGEAKPNGHGRAAERKRDLAWEALMAGCDITDEQLTEAARKPYNGALANITKANPGLDREQLAAEIAVRCAAFKRQWPNVTLTPTALARRWSELRVKRSVRRASSAEDTAAAQRQVDLSLKLDYARRRARDLGLDGQKQDESIEAFHARVTSADTGARA